MKDFPAYSIKVESFYNGSEYAISYDFEGIKAEFNKELILAHLLAILQREKGRIACFNRASAEEILKFNEDSRKSK